MWARFLRIAVIGAVLSDGGTVAVGREELTMAVLIGETEGRRYHGYRQYRYLYFTTPLGPAHGPRARAQVMHRAAGRTGQGSCLCYSCFNVMFWAAAVINRSVFELCCWDQLHTGVWCWDTREGTPQCTSHQTTLGMEVITAVSPGMDLALLCLFIVKTCLHEI